MSEHLTQQQLLRHLDGEMRVLEERKAEKHLRACWSCQAELGRLQAQIAEILEAEQKVYEPALPEPPRPWARLEPKLAQAGAAGESRERAGWLPKLNVPRWAWGGAAAAVVIAWTTWLAAPVALAKEALRRAAVETEQRQRVSGKAVLRQRVSVRRARRQGAAVENSSLSAYRWAQGSYWRLQDDPVGAELRERYAANGMGEALPLSGAALEGWTRLTGGWARASRSGETTSVEVASAEAGLARGLERVSIELEGGEYRVKAMTLSFRDAEFRIQEEETVEAARGELPADVLAKLGGEEREATAVARQSAGVPAPAENRDELEMAVRYELHGIGADLGEGIEITAREGEGVVVDARQSSEEMKARLKPLLAERAGVRLILEGEPSKGNTQGGVSRVIPDKSTGGGSRDRKLSTYFGSAGAQENFTRLALAGSGNLLEHAYAWHELARRWPAEAEKGLTKTAQEQLKAILRDHGREITARVEELEDLLHPMVKGMDVQAGEWQPTRPLEPQANGEIAVTLAQRTDKLLRAMLTDSDQRVTAEAALPEIVRNLQELEWRAQQLRQSKRQ